jgi:hypothetical protein
MKRFFISTAVILAALSSGAQVFDVVSIDKVNTPLFVDRPVISPDGSSVFVTGEDINGIYSVDIASGDSKSLVSGSGLYGVRVSDDGSQIVYNEPSVKNKLRYVSLKSLDVKTLKTNTVVKATRRLNAGVAFAGNTVAAIADGKVKTRTSVGKKTTPRAIASIDYGHLMVTVDGVSTAIDPQGRGSYLWPSISPDGTKVLYWATGYGAFVCDLDGSNAVSLGTIRAAVWAGNNAVVGMYDRDNGNEIVASEIVAADLDGNRQTLTDSSMIALYPSALADGSKVAFATLDGALYVITINR